jgi:hypothetical protein
MIYQVNGAVVLDSIRGMVTTCPVCAVLLPHCHPVQAAVCMASDVNMMLSFFSKQ